jgi:anti-sigma factor RsiW
MSRRDRVPDHDLEALVRLLHGELPAAEAAALRARLAREPELAAAHDRLAAAWAAAEPPPAAPPPAGFTARVMARVRAESRAPGWAQAPPWARAAAAAAALAGMLAGVGLGLRLPAAAPETGGERIAAAGKGLDLESLALDGLDAEGLDLDDGLAGGYWQALGLLDAAGAAAPAPAGEGRP